MKRSKMKIVLASSQRMKEHSYIRFPKAARKYYDAAGKKIKVTGGPDGFVVLEIHQAIMKDVREFAGKLASVGFVTTKTFNLLQKNKGKETWVSESIDNLLVGSDPEFGLVDDEGLYVYAGKLDLPGLSMSTPLGVDGPCMEFRPKPTSNSEGHLRELKKLIKKGSTMKGLANLRWYTGATYKSSQQERRYNLGGHIHIGNPAILETLEYDTVNKVHRMLIRVLDELVGIPLTKIDGPSARTRRAQYGKYGEFRQQENRVEWRAPSAVWLTHPEFARAVVGTCKAVTEECYRRMTDKKFRSRWLFGSAANTGTFLRDLSCDSDEEVRKALHDTNRASLTKASVTKFHKKLLALSTYAKYKEDVDLFIRLTLMTAAKARKIDLWKIRENWLGNNPL